MRLSYYFVLVFTVGLVLVNVSTAAAFQQPRRCWKGHHHHQLSSLRPLFYAATKDSLIVEQNKEYLINTLGFTEDKVQKMNENTNILTLDVGVLEERANWLQQRLDLEDGTNQLKKIVQQQGILGKRTDTNLGPTLDYLQTRLLLDNNSLKKLVLLAPHILGCSIEENIEPKLDWLQERLALNDIQLGKMISRQPYTLGCSITDNLAPTLYWLQQRLSLDDSTISKIIQSNPQIMHLNIESNLEPKLNWLQQRLESDDTALRKIIQRMPSILGLSIDDNLEPKLEWIQEHLSLTDDGLSKFIQKSSSILSCNVETNLRPTLKFYIDALEGDKQEAVALIVNNPTLLNYSLDKRLKPRLEEAKSTVMSSFNKSDNGGQRKRGNFDSVPADDGFRSYMARKIELQRKQFGLQPPPPPSPPQEPKPAPPKILKKAKLTKNNHDDNNVPIPQFTDSIPSNSNANRSERKSVRFHHNVDIEGKSVSHVLANLKQKHTSGRRKIRRSSSANKRRRSSQGLASDANGVALTDDSASNNGLTDSMSAGEETNDSSNSYTSILGVLDNLQKRYGTSSSKRKRSSNASHSSRKRKHDNQGVGGQRLSVESAEEGRSVGSFSTNALEDDNEGVDGSSAMSSRKRENDRCKGISILEEHESARWQGDRATNDKLNRQHSEEQSQHLSTNASPKPRDFMLTQLAQPSPAVESRSPPSRNSQRTSPCSLSQTLENAAKSPCEINATASLTSTHVCTSTASTHEPTKPALKANHRPDLFFAGVVVLVNGHTSPDATTLMRLLHKHGGDLEKYETRRVTHIIAEQLSAAKANIYKRQKNPTPVCRPEWITDSVEQWKLLPFGDYLLEDVRDEDVIGTKSVKSFFSTKPGNKDASPVIGDGNAGSNESYGEEFTNEEDESAIICSNVCSTNESSSHRWQDTHPSKANYHLNGQVRTVGNDPNFLDSYFSNSRLSYIGSFKQRVKPTKTKAPRSQAKLGARKFVLLVDMDCFFASVALRKYPQYRDKPVAVGHSHIARSNAAENAATTKTYRKNSSSELSTCNYVARKYGIRKGMFLGDAIVLCENLVVLPYDFEGYEEVSGVVADQLHAFADQYDGCVEQVSCDESYVEINIVPTDCPSNDIYGFVNTLAEHIRADILKKTECTASVGIGPNKLLAKLAADRVKPNACCVVKDWREFLDERNLRDIPGIGRKFQKKLKPHGVCTVNDIWDLEDDAETVLGAIIGLGNARKIVQYCHGNDDRSVTPVIRKTIGAECNYGVRFDGKYGVDYMIHGLAKEVETRMCGACFKGSKLVLKVMKSKDLSKVPGKFLGHGRCDSFSRSVDITLTRDKDMISAAAMKLYDRLGIDQKFVRGMGIVIGSLKSDDEVDSSGSPSKLSAWLKKDSNAPINSRSHDANIQDRELSLLEEPDASQMNVTFAIEGDAENPLKKSYSDCSPVPTFSQLDQDVLHNLPKDILNEVKFMYKSSSQQSQNVTQSSAKSPKRKHSGKAKKSDRQIPIAGQTSVRRMLKLACVKSGEDRLDGKAISLSQLDCLPLEVQLQIANEDDIKIAKILKHKTKRIQDLHTLTDDQIDPTDMDVLPAQSSQIKEQDHSSLENLPTNFYQENIAPLRDFIAANPNPDFETVEIVKDFLSLCVHEKRIDDAVTFLRTIKNMQDGWDRSIYSQLMESTTKKIFSSAGNLIDTMWLDL
ncbi:hypothetical protein ACHAXR_012758 [Thalassiosira sp. AJA248-18]